MIKGDARDAGATARPAPLSPSLDALSTSLITMLQVDGRRSHADLAQELGVEEKLVRRRVAELIGNDVIHIAAVCDPSRLGFKRQSMIMLRCVDGQAPFVAQQLADRREFVYVITTMGEFDVMAELFDAGDEGLHATIAALHQMPGVLEVRPHLYDRVEKLFCTWTAG